MYLYVLKLCAWKYKQKDDDDDEIKNKKIIYTINNTYKLKRFASYWERESNREKFKYFASISYIYIYIYRSIYVWCILYYLSLYWNIFSKKYASVFLSKGVHIYVYNKYNMCVLVCVYECVRVKVESKKFGAKFFDFFKECFK